MLTDEQQSRLSRILKDLETLDLELSEQNFEHFLQLFDNNSETILYGNAEGLVYLSTLLLTLAQKRIEGNHFHIDNPVMDKSEKTLEVALRNVPWESRD